MMRRRLPAVAALAALLVTGCAPAPDGGRADGAADAAGAPTGTITVAAAASLADAVAAIAADFEAAHPGARVAPIVSDGSSTIAAQLRAGAPYDVFVSADEATLDGVAELVEAPVPLASNSLVIVVPEGNPGGVAALADLARVSTVVCAPEVPCGAASARLLALHGLTLTPRSLEQNVRSVLAKVEADAVDAGLVYATDAAASETVETIEADRADEVVTRAVMAVVRDSDEAAIAAAFVEHARGPAARELLDGLGFGPP